MAHKQRIVLPTLRFGDCPGCAADARRVPSAHAQVWPGVYRCVVAHRRVAASAIEDRRIDEAQRRQAEQDIYGEIYAAAGAEILILLLLRDIALALPGTDRALVTAVNELVDIIREDGEEAP